MNADVVIIGAGPAGIFTRFVFSSHRLKMIISALDNCSIIIAFIFM